MPPDAGGATPVIAADPVAEKRREALALGADFAFDPLAPDFAMAVGGYAERVVVPEGMVMPTPSCRSRRRRGY